MAQDYSRKFYKSRKWATCRDAYMGLKRYTCERCGRCADIVHHRKYITEENINNPNVTLNWDNLEALCMECHGREHNSTEATAEEIKFDSSGNIIYSGG